MAALRDSVAAQCRDARASAEWLVRYAQRRQQLQSKGGGGSVLPAPPRPSGGGTIEFGDEIEFRDVTIVSPDGRLLVEHLSFSVRRGHNVMVTGPNGAGKSSVFRVLGELWPVHSGTVVKPAEPGDILFVPQKPYFVWGTLRDQVIYPHSTDDMRRLGVTDDDLSRLLDIVDPSSTILGQWSWEDSKDWVNTFSGGQKQRVAMARVFYHRPRMAILDECTSAVSDEVEGKIYETCKALGMTLFTVSHRPQLARYHDHQLRLDGRGGYTWTDIGEEEQKKSKEEKEEVVVEKEKEKVGGGGSGGGEQE